MKKRNETTINAGLRKSTGHEVSVYIRISQDRKNTWIKIEGFKIHPSEWTGKYGEWISKKNRDHKSLNLKIEERLLEFKKSKEKIGEKKRLVTQTDILKTVKVRENARDFMTYFKSKTEAIKKRGTRQVYEGTYQKIIDFAGEALSFEDMTPEWIFEFDAWMKGKRLAPGTIKNKMKSIRRIWNDATLIEKIVDRNLYPFGKGGYSIPDKPKTVKKPTQLDPNEVRSIMDLKYPSTDLLFYAQKSFLLSFHCSGIRASDLLSLRWSDNVRKNVISYQMDKNGKDRNITITPAIRQILDELMGGEIKSGGYIFPFLPEEAEQVRYDASDNEWKKIIASKLTILNGLLKTIAKHANVPEFSTHDARHSWAGYVYSETKDIILIRDELNHSSTKITEEYIGSLGFNDRSERVGGLMEKLTGKQPNLRIA